MELTELRRIKNTGKLPGFANGLPDWQPTPQYFPEALGNKSVPGIVPYTNFPTVNAEDYGGGLPGLRNALNLDKAPEVPADFKPEIKGVQNTSKSKSPIKMEQVSGIVPAAIAFGSDLYNSGRYNRSQDELLAQGGQSQNSVGGIGYDEYNGVNMSSFNNEVKQENTQNTLRTAGSGAALGAAAGSIIPGLGTVAGGLIGGAVGLVGGLFGSSRRSKEAERQARLANQTASIYNTFNRSGAASARLQLDALQRNGNTQNQLRGYHDGRGSDYTGGFARLSNGEVLVKGDQIIDRIPGLPNFKDGVTAYVGDAGVVSNHKVGGMRNSDYVMATGDVQGGLMRDMFWRKQHGKGYRNGKLPEFAEGYLGNLIPSGLGMLASVGQYLDASGQDLATSTTRVHNKYERDALNRLAGLRINQYPIIDNLYGAQRIADSGVNMSGLSGYQRAKARLANLANTQKAISDAAINIQAQNNQYDSAASTMESQLGAQQAQWDLQGIMNDQKRLDEAHGRRQQGKQTGIYNFLNQLQSFYANEFKRRQFNDTMDLYRQNLQLDRDKFNRDLKNYNDIVGVPGMPTPRLYTPSMPLTTGKRLSSNLTPTALWTPANSQYLLPGSQSYDDYNIWNLKRRGIIK